MLADKHKDADPQTLISTLFSYRRRSNKTRHREAYSYSDELETRDRRAFHCMADL